MCNLSAGLIERGVERGIDIGVERGIDIGVERGIDIGVERGIDIGRAEGIAKGIANMVVNAYKNKKSIDTIMDFMEMSREEVCKILRDNGFRVV